MKVHEVMLRDSECVGPNDSLGAAADLMRRFQIRAVPVLDHTRPSGVVTERKVEGCKRELGRDPLLLKVREAMVECTAFVLEDDELDDAVRTMMANGVTEIAVLDHEHRLVGLLLTERLPEPV